MGRTNGSSRRAIVGLAGLALLVGASCLLVNNAGHKPPCRTPGFRQICDSFGCCTCGPPCDSDDDCVVIDPGADGTYVPLRCAFPGTPGPATGVCVREDWPPSVQTCTRPSAGHLDPGTTTCGAGQIPVREPDGTVTCQSECSGDWDCSTCCLTFDTGLRGCSPSPAYCPGTGPDPSECRDLTDCLYVIEESCSAGGICGDPAAIDCTVTLANNCSEPLWAKLCFEERSGGWTCGEDDVAAGGTYGNWNCGGTAGYWYSGNEPDDFGTGCVPSPD